MTFRTFLIGALAFCCAGAETHREYFVITVIDEQTNRGVPLVQLETVNHLKFLTDSAGVVAFNEPGLMNQRVFFNVTSHGYEFAKDGFGIRGVALETKPGGEATIKIKRLNIAERLYRITGEGIYRDSVLAGRKPPIAQPLLNAQVVGQDSTQAVICRGKIHWFWGDTSRASYPLGHFGTAGAVSELPGEGGLDPSVGIDLKYFVDDKGFSRPMIPPRLGASPRWLDGVVVIKDGDRERLLGRCDTVKSLAQRVERELVVYNDETDTLDRLAPLDRDEPLSLSGHPFHHVDNGIDYIYCTDPFPWLRVRADLDSIKTPAAYEGFTCLAPGTRYVKGQTKLDRDADGKLIWSWKKDAPPISYEQQSDLIKAGAMKGEECWNHLRDIETGDEVRIAGGNVAWNEFKKKWILIGVQTFGKPSFFGEVWYGESDRQEGPWSTLRRIVTHDRYSFYNPVHHRFFDQQGGRVIYFEGTYATLFSRPEGQETPRYDYNQVMYRLDLGDERLKLP